MVTDSERVASFLLLWLDQKKQEQWEKAINCINFLQFSHKAWSNTNKLFLRSEHYSRLFLVSANSITSQIMKNMAHKMGDRKSTRLINKDMSNTWGDSIFGLFISDELATTLNHLGPVKSLGLDSTFPELILLTRSALKTCLCDFFTSCILQLKIPRIWKRALVAILSQISRWDPES